MTQSVHTPQHKSVAQAARTKLSVSQPPTYHHSKEKACKVGLDSEISLDNMLSESERFELLSAYIDDEVSTEERQTVEQWLASDVHMQQTYQAQIKLSRAMQSMLRDDYGE